MDNSYLIGINDKNELLGSKMPDGTFYNPVKDINGNWFIFEKEYEECGLGVLSEFIPPVNDTII